eukprot:g4425.t1
MSSLSPPIHTNRSSSAPPMRRKTSVGRSIFARGLRFVTCSGSEEDDVDVDTRDKDVAGGGGSKRSDTVDDTKEGKEEESEKKPIGTVFIMRGIPGSGKSYLAKSIAAEHENSVVCSADDYFIDEKTGKYNFDFRKLQQAHAQCMTRYLDALLARSPAIIVDNTHTRLWEYSHQEKIARLSGYALEVREIECPNKQVAEFCAKRNGHEVPLKNVLKMWRRFETDERAVKKIPFGVPEGLLKTKRGGGKWKKKK